MSKIDDGGPAFPSGELKGGYGTIGTGMSLSDYLAAHASNPPDWWILHVCNIESFPVGGLEYNEAVASWKYMQADAMIARRKVPPTIMVKRVPL